MYYVVYYNSPMNCGYYDCDSLDEAVAYAEDSLLQGARKVSVIYACDGGGWIELQFGLHGFWCAHDE